MTDQPADQIPELRRLKQISERLVNPELALRILQEELPVAVVVTTDDGRIVLFNRRAELMFGYSRSEVTGELVEILLPQDRRERHVQHRTGYVEEPRERPMGSEMLLAGRHKTRGDFEVKVMLAPVQTSEGLYIMAAIWRTERTERRGD